MTNIDKLLKIDITFLTKKYQIIAQKFKKSGPWIHTET